MPISLQTGISLRVVLLDKVGNWSIFHYFWSTGCLTGQCEELQISVFIISANRTYPGSGSNLPRSIFVSPTPVRLVTWMWTAMKNLVIWRAMKILSPFLPKPWTISFRVKLSQTIKESLPVCWTLTGTWCSNKQYSIRNHWISRNTSTMIDVIPDSKARLPVSTPF